MISFCPMILLELKDPWTEGLYLLRNLYRLKIISLQQTSILEIVSKQSKHRLLKPFTSASINRGKRFFHDWKWDLEVLKGELELGLIILHLQFCNKMNEFCRACSNQSQPLIINNWQMRGWGWSIPDGYTAAAPVTSCSIASELFKVTQTNSLRTEQGLVWLFPAWFVKTLERRPGI